MSDEKPPILQDQEFTIEEGFLYRALRTGAIWMNKLFFSSLFLLAVWLVMGYASGIAECTGSPNLVETENGTVDQGEGETCSVILTPTAKYLGAMSLASFALSVAFGLLGLVVGKRVIESTAAGDEPGAPERSGDDRGAEHRPTDAPDGSGGTGPDDADPPGGRPGDDERP